MTTVNYNVTFDSDTAIDGSGLIVSPSYLIDMCFYGIPLCTVDGRTLSNDTISNYIMAAQAEIERLLELRLRKMIVEENQDFFIDDWKSWGFVQASFPVVKAFTLEGYVNTIRQVNYPTEWLSIKKTSDGRYYQRRMYLVPVGTATANFESIVFSGVLPSLSFLAMVNIPNYWNMTYGTGFDKVPQDIIKSICYMAAIPLYMWLGNNIIPAGLSSATLSIDGLSQTRAIEPGGFSTRIKQLKDDLGTIDKNSSGLLSTLKDHYNSLNLYAL